jgi:NAD(P)-dependent dehydrogenase (short-subunit alcohol dehydrogenase family)
VNQTVLITGASKRVGKAIAEHLAEKGWNIAIHFNSSEKPAGELVNELTSKYPHQKFLAFKANLIDIDKVLTLIPKVLDAFGEIHLLVNNASVFDPGYLKLTQPDLFEEQINVNLKAPFFLIRDYANLCKKGNIINFVDTRVTSNKSNFSAYSLSKKGLWNLTQMAALELAPDIRVNAIAPGVTLAPEDKDENYLLNLAQNIPMKKPGGLDPIIKSVDFILENNHLTGQLLFADGGENLGGNI